MKLHIFNPEHDLALAVNQPNYTAPHAGRQLRNDLAFIPALWADEGDFVMVDSIDDAYDKVRHLGYIYNKVEFITPRQLEGVFRDTMEIDSIHPWGWDKAIVSQLRHLGCPDIMLPTSENLDKIRCVSSREWAARHLQNHVDFVADVTKLKDVVSRKGQAIIKSPWSSSGRGLRYVNSSFSGVAQNPGITRLDNLDDMEKWAANVIRHQGGVTVEPYYNKVKDFGMEFEMVDGVVKYCGLSLFQTIKGAYAGNILASEEEKEEILASYVSLDKLAQIRQHIIETLQPVLKSIYSGPFGVDMMIYADDERRLQINPCVELNLRRTMGHVALSLGVSEKTAGHIMQVSFDGNKHRLRVLPGLPSESAPYH